MKVGHAAIDSFLDELTKIAAAHGRMHLPKSRIGRRSMSVTTMLDREARGALFRKHADAAGNPQPVRGDSSDDPGAAPLPKRPGDVPTKDPSNIPVSAKLGMFSVNSEGPAVIPMGESPYAYQEAKKPRKKGDVPSKDDSNVVDRQDGRDFAATVPGPAYQSGDIGAFNSPAEHS